MAEQLNPTEVQITLTLNLQQVNAVLRGLGELPTSAGVWPLTQTIVSQAQAQIPEQSPEEPAAE
jgi:hypothetical protein